MNALRLFLFTILLLCGARLNAQAIILTGHVTSVEGNLASDFSVGDTVRLFYDFSHAGDIFNGQAPHLALYEVATTLTINGTRLPLFDNGGFTSKVEIMDYGSIGNEGLFADFTWYADGKWDPGFDFGTQRHFRQVLFTDTQNKVLTSVTDFPSGIPMDRFFDTSGFYTRDLIYGFGAGDPPQTGRVDWEITSYTGFPDVVPPSLSPVPEPSVYGLLASACLGGMVLRRRIASRAKAD